ncbi:ClpP protease [Roseibium sp. TrichSKD4]|uniref:head maturation protease, ClpP-related n=1 Tax=Roseibium sp. TrichSKD4 TaxID=744980 RepID=UPI0001E56B14|nr:head maturation protease, ClpP-related [Roseibium sp. TrichSKD4]EFO32610.1 ClpP protease [Roseibium sp. TrichSKD4]
MSLRTLPELSGFTKPNAYQWDAPSDVLASWAEAPMASGSLENTIAIFDVIGEDPWTGEGFTAKRARAALRAIGDEDVTVQINSPGGDLFEGTAIYNLLREHPAKVTVEVVGWAASAGSIIAMGSDEIRMGPGTKMMVHNAWGAVVGNRHDFKAGMELFEKFDAGIVDIYEARTGADRADIVRLMDEETFLSPEDAKKLGFADVVDNGLSIPEANVHDGKASLIAKRRTEAALAKAGYTRQQRTELISAMESSAALRDASRHPAARDAGINEASVRELIEMMKA